MLSNFWNLLTSKRTALVAFWKTILRPRPEPVPFSFQLSAFQFLFPNLFFLLSISASQRFSFSAFPSVPQPVLSLLRLPPPTPRSPPSADRFQLSAFRVSAFAFRFSVSAFPSVPQPILPAFHSCFPFQRFSASVFQHFLQSAFQLLETCLSRPPCHSGITHSNRTDVPCLFDERSRYMPTIRGSQASNRWLGQRTAFRRRTARHNG
jgi:hypothetical protein